MSVADLMENVDRQVIKIRTDSLDVSFNELYDMYQNEELIIAPDYQRLFRWEEETQSRFIESLIIEMPVPPIYVVETDDGIYELIDGLQRISSYLHFRGEPLGEEQGTPLVLHGCDIVPDLNGLTFDGLPKALQIKIKRRFVRMEVIRKESEPTLKYHMFKRLNTGGELLSAQEIRNCTIRLLGTNGIQFLEECSQNSDFRTVISRIGENKFKTRYDQELVLRFFAVKNDLPNYRYPVTEYLTRYLEKMTTGIVDFEYNKERRIFQDTFGFINHHWGADAFSGKTPTGTFRNEFVSYYFDAIAVPLAMFIERINHCKSEDAVKTRIDEMKFSEELQQHNTGSVANVRARIRQFTEGVKEILDSE